MESVRRLAHARFEESKGKIQAACAPGDLKAQMTVLLGPFRLLASPGNRTRDPRSETVGRRTAWERQRHMVYFIEAVHEAGLHPEFIWNLGPRHVQAAVAVWLAEGLATQTIRTRLSAVAMLFGLLCKPEAKPANGELLPADRQRVPTYATRDKTWSGNGVSLEATLERVPATDAWVGDALTLQRAFGLRAAESLLIDIHESDRGVFLWLHRGTKGKRPRFVPVETPAQRALIDALKARYPAGQALIGAEHAISALQAKKRYGRVLNDKLGISKAKSQVSGHGLRTEYFADQYERMTGAKPPIQGGKPLPRALDREARAYIAYLAGHGRRDVVGRYLGRTLFGWRDRPGVPRPEIRLTRELALVVRHQSALFHLYAQRKVEADRARALRRVLPAAGSVRPRRRR